MRGSGLAAAVLLRRPARLSRRFRESLLRQSEPDVRRTEKLTERDRPGWLA
jgi:hypothetical protein